MLNSEFSSKFGRRPEVLASLVVLGMFSLDALAERFYINKFYLTRVFKDQFGLSVTSYLTQLRITQAKRLLRFTDKSVENVAQECGLNDANYFSRLFKKVEGTTPGEYRRQW